MVFVASPCEIRVDNKRALSRKARSVLGVAEVTSPRTPCRGRVPYLDRRLETLGLAGRAGWAGSCFARGFALARLAAGCADVVFNFFFHVGVLSREGSWLPLDDLKLQPCRL